MAALRRAIAPATVSRLQLRSVLACRPRSLAVAVSQSRLYTSTAPRRQTPNAFHSQLENTPNAADLLAHKPAPVANPQTLTEKIVQKYSVGLAPGKVVRSGDFVSMEPQHIMTHDNTWPVAKKFLEIGASKIHNNRQAVFTLDHDVGNFSEANLTKYRKIEEFAREQGVEFYGAGQGIGHERMVHEGYAWPGTMAVASDSHSNHYGGVGALGTPVVRTDAASLWAVGRTWWQVPPIAKINLIGILPVGVTGKDVIMALCGLFNQDEVLNHALEFTGSEETLASIPIDMRVTIANQSTEWGALSGLFPVDDMLISWYRAKATTAAMLDTPTKTRVNHERIDQLIEDRLVADPGATYAKELYINLSTLAPVVAGPNSVKVINPVATLEEQNIAINKAYLVSCTNSRASDIASAAQVFREAAAAGKPAKVAPGVKFYLSAASIEQQKMAEEAGDWQVLIDAGAQVLRPGCAQCIGLGEGLLEAGEVGVSASNRNFKGRMGSTEAHAYLASPEIVAASALQGKITGPGWYQKPKGVKKVIIGEGSGDYVADKARSFENAFDKLLGDMDAMIAAAESAEGAENSSKETAAPATTEDESLVDLLPGFPEKVEGEIVFCDADNINTDGIYPGTYSQGKYTYQDNVSRETMAEVCMENYDKEFRNIAKGGDILVTGFNTGCGSSREQAATSILAKGIPLVVAGSFGNIFSRNSINNALMGLEVPKLIQRLRETFKDDPSKPLTRRTGWKLLWDVRRSKVVITEEDGSSWEQKVGELPPNIQEIIAKGGLEAWVKSQISA